MLTRGQLFQLTSDIVAIEPFENRMRATVIPCGSAVCVVKYPCADDNRTAEVLWNGKPVVMFVLDLRNRAKELKALTAAVGAAA